MNAYAKGKIKGAAHRVAVFAAMACLPLVGGSNAYAQAGISVLPGATPTGTVGSNKNLAGSAAYQCPAGTVALGLHHTDRPNTGVTVYRGLTSRFGLYCGNIAITQQGVSVVPLNTQAPTVVTNYNYVTTGPNSDQLCGTGRIIHRVGGWDRDWDQVASNVASWSSALTMVCDTVTLDESGWVRVATTGGVKTTVGVIEAPPAGNLPTPNHVERGPFCDNTPNALVTGLYAQTGGLAIDGVNVYCGTLVQARFSAALNFSDFAWSQVRGTGGWTVDLRQNQTLLVGADGVTGEARTPYAAVSANNVNNYTSVNEVYVVPNSNYRATINARPTGIASAHYHLSGDCTTGFTLADVQDGTCLLNVDGLADLAVSAQFPTQAYQSYGQEQPVTITVSNRGPGATVANDGFVLRAELPAAWVVANLPAGCTQTGQVVSCPLGALAAAASPAATGGIVSYTLNIAPASPAATGTFNMPVRIDASVPNGDNDQGNNDFNLANNEIIVNLVLALNAELRLVKSWINAVANDIAALSATSPTGPSATLASVADTATETDTGQFVGAPLGAVYNLSETLGASNTGAYNASVWTCTGGTLSGAQLTIRPEDSGNNVECVITNTRQAANVRVTKTASAPAVRSGQDITWTITAFNDGPDAANGAIVTDTPGAGLDCSIPPPPPVPCTSTGGATCPADTSATALASGVTIGSFPSGSSVTITLRCRATASGL